MRKTPDYVAEREDLVGQGAPGYFAWDGGSELIIDSENDTIRRNAELLDDHVDVRVRDDWCTARYFPCRASGSGFLQTSEICGQRATS